MKKVSIFYLNLVVFLYSLAANFAHPVTPTFIQNLGLHDYMFGLAFACMSFSNFLFSPFWGKMSHKYGSAKVLGIAHIGYGLMQMMFGLSTKEWQICLARFGGGFFISAISVSQMLYIVENSKNPGKDLALMGTINIVTSQFGFLVGGFLGDISIRLCFITQAVSLASIGVLALLIMKDGRIEKYSFTLKEINPFIDFVNCKDVLTKGIIYFLLVTLLFFFGSTAYEQCFNYYIKDVFDFPTSYNGIVKAIIGFVSLAANSFITMRLIRNTDTNKSSLYICLLLIAMIFGVIAFDSFIPFMVVNILFFGFNSMFTPILQDMMSHHKTEKQAEFVGLYNAIKMLGNVFGSLLAGFIYATGPKISFVMTALALVACLFVLYLHLKEEKQQQSL